MKKYVLFLYMLLFVPVASYATDITCLFKDSTSVDTPNRHCSKHCKGWADQQPIEKLTLKMNDEWKKKGAFFKNPTARCEGGNGCSYINLGKPRTFESGKSVDLSYKTWSIPVTITLEADICIVQ